MRRRATWTGRMLVALAAGGVVGCVSTGRLGLVGQLGPNPGELLSEAHAYRELGPVEGRACRYFVLAIIPFGNSTMSAAIEKALGAEGDALVNVSASTSLYGFVPIYNVLAFTCTTVQGTAIAIDRVAPGPDVPAAPAEPPASGGSPAVQDAGQEETAEPGGE